MPLKTKFLFQVGEKAGVVPSSNIVYSGISGGPIGRSLKTIAYGAALSVCFLKMLHKNLILYDET